MERLSFDKTNSYSALEAAIHSARYAIAKPVCQGRDALDIACGEGYGAALLKEWGAATVDGIDISDTAIASACTNFLREGVSFRLGSAEEVSSVFPNKKYNLIVSLETFEHLDDPRIYLREIKSIATDDAVIIISCPNDNWYYPEENQNNPFHKRKYTFSECRKICEEVLGPANWRFGGLAIGFMTTGSYPETISSRDQTAMMEYNIIRETIMVPPDDGTAPEPGYSSYFVGIWGKPDLPLSAAIFPSSLKAIQSGPFSGINSEAAAHEIDRLNESIHQVEDSKRALENAAREEIDELRRSARRSEMNRKALAAENNLLREAVSRASHAQAQSSSELVELHSKVISLQTIIEQLSNDSNTLKRLNDKLRHENKKIKSNNEAARVKLRNLTKEIQNVPWRVVRIYKVIRNKVPSPVLRAAGRVIEKTRAKKK